MSTTLSQKRQLHDGSDGNSEPPRSSKRHKWGPTNADTKDTNNSERLAFTASDYDVGWLCALPLELAASCAMLDVIHDSLPQGPEDTNTYTLGSIGRKNIVITCLPAEGMGLHNAAIVASHMRRSFPCLHMFLMVGIGGGAPSADNDIRLGDVAVSTKVVQWDFGKIVHDGRTQSTSVPRAPSQALMSALSTLQARHKIGTSQIQTFLDEMLQRFPTMAEYADKSGLEDMLFDCDYEHDATLKHCDNCDQSRLMNRATRDSAEPKIHYGLIASGSRVIKHGTTRDQLAREFNAICFEMEAAALMDTLRCLVIRGICDYSDSHKNKKWQPYAAAVAAAYARELILVMPAAIPRSTNLIVQDGTRQTLDRKSLIDSLSFESIDARQISIRPALKKTCRWLLNHPEFLRWLDPRYYIEHHGFLWIYGKPGVGKSTIMKFIHAKYTEIKTITTISFFFHARGSDLEKSTEGLYRSLLFQLLQKVPDLDNIIDSPVLLRQTQRDGEIVWDLEVLRGLFSRAIHSLADRQVMCFVDALDECGESQVRDMISFFEDLGDSAIEAGTKLYICFSSRHYPTINIENSRTLVLENQSGHTEDLEKYVKTKLKAGKRSADVENLILEKSAGVFLWVVLVIEILNKEFARGRLFAVKKRLDEIPAELSKLFKDILLRDTENMSDLLLCIQWILFAKRPLKPEEFYFAVVSGLDPDPESLIEWNPEQMDAVVRFVSSSSKGLAETTKTKHRIVQFIHESVRDFLLKDGGLNQLWPDLGNDFKNLSHEQLKRCCYVYFQTTFPHIRVLSTILPLSRNAEAKAIREDIVQKLPFLEYATQHVLYHADIASASQSQGLFLDTFDLQSWTKADNVFEKHNTSRHTENATLIYISAKKGLVGLIKVLLTHGLCALPAVGERYMNPLHAAMAKGQKDAVAVILQYSDKTLQGINETFRGQSKLTLIAWAVEHGFKDIVELLLRRGAPLDLIFN
ncbi:hypothetical protein F5Y18DRAFT_194887 [Xylariaceae sp. FL1019]|nr:hypothetical protein F5Y18DRAFT_194887 [Xylariaceae sp. FL1019]